MKLTAKQWEVCRLVAEGLTNRQAGKQMGYTRLYFSNLLRTIRDVTGMSTRLELALWYVHQEANQLIPNLDRDRLQKRPARASESNFPSSNSLPRQLCAELASHQLRSVASDHARLI